MAFDINDNARQACVLGKQLHETETDRVILEQQFLLK
jgi:hypothetical protein